jgi:acetyl-CoA carboxylase / biotin carboxylase 1
MLRSVRKFSYETFGNERAIEFVAMATPEDLKVNADYIRMSDRYVEVPGGTNNHNYANVDVIVDVAEREGVQAVWAGWYVFFFSAGGLWWNLDRLIWFFWGDRGHASENPRLPETLAKHKIVFIGPPGSAMRSLGDKISSTIVAQSADVPTMPWWDFLLENQKNQKNRFLSVFFFSGAGVLWKTRLSTSKGFWALTTMFIKKLVWPTSKKVWRRLMVCRFPRSVIEEHSKPTWLTEVTYPVMIKASEGGGGKGIRKVESKEGFKLAFEAVSSEVPG